MEPVVGSANHDIERARSGDKRSRHSGRQLLRTREGGWKLSSIYIDTRVGGELVARSIQCEVAGTSISIRRRYGRQQHVGWRRSWLFHWRGRFHHNRRYVVGEDVALRFRSVVGRS